MLEQVEVAPRSLAAYRGIAPEAVLEDLVRVASELHGARVLHVNATPYGGGVSEHDPVCGMSVARPGEAVAEVAVAGGAP